MVVINRGAVRIRKVLSISFDKFPLWVVRHLASDYTTPAVEHHGFDYVANGFQVGQTEAFVKAVCRWGGSPNIANMLLENYEIRAIRDQLKEGYIQLLKRQPQAAIEEVSALAGLGISYASKHLRFLYPAGAVILDSIIRGRLGYPESPDGFAEFLHDCQLIRDELNQLALPVSAFRTHWRVADVEMAIFSKIKKL